MAYTRNSDLTFYESNRQETNCGSYALRLNEWYDLDDPFEDLYGEITGWIHDMAMDYTDEEISEIYGEALVDIILKDFEGEIVVCDGRPPKTKDVELIAFSVFCYYNEDYNYSDWDYHFKVLRDGVWKEKCGMDIVRECDKNDWLDRYVSDVVYFYHKVGGSND